MRTLVLFACGFVTAAALSAAPVPSGEYFVYFGTYTGFKFISHGLPAGRSESQGIYVARFQPSTGEISEPRLAAKVTNPSFLAIHPNHRFLYAVIEDPLSVGPYKDKASYVSAFAIESDGALRLLNTVPAHGTSTCYISLDKSGRYAMVANFGSGSVTLFKLNADGSLGPETGFDQHTGKSVDPVYQAGPHAHSIDVSPDDRYAVSSDLGLDKLLIYKFDPATGSLAPNNAEPWVVVKPPTGGPRHFVFSADGRFGYSLAEMSGVLTVYKWESSQGSLAEIQEITMKTPEFDRNETIVRLNSFHSAEVALHPNGKYLYASNRGPDTIAVFSVDAGNGTLTPVEEVSSRGLMPRQFAIDPTGSYLMVANEASDDIAVLAIDPATGRLAPTRKIAKINSPSCVAFVPVLQQ